MPVEIVGVPTVRESDGLAMSSRNGYLSPEERAQAPALYHALAAARRSLLEGVGVETVERTAAGTLRDAGLEPDYVSVRVADTLLPPSESDQDLVVLAAAYLGRARLIDNLRVRLGSDAALQQTLL